MTTATLEKITTTRIELPYEEARIAYGSVLPHTSKDDVTPVIVGMQVFEHEGKGYVIATDRYTVGRYELSALPELVPGVDGLFIPRTAAEWVTKIAPTSLRYKGMPQAYSVRVEAEPNPDSTLHFDIIVSLVWNADPEAGEPGKVERSQRFDGVKGNFPPVNRLIPTETFDIPTTRLAPVHLKKFIDSHAAIGVRSAETLEFHGATTTNPLKPGPLQIKIGDKFVGLIQPHLIPR